MLARMKHRPGFGAAPGCAFGLALRLSLALSCATLALSCTSNLPSNPDGSSPGAAGAGNAGGAGTGSGGTAGTTTSGAGTSGGAGAGLGGRGGAVIAGGAGAGGASAATGGAGGLGGRAGTSGGATAVAGTGGAIGGGGAGGAQWSSAFPTFTRRTIASFSSGYSTCVADIDHDGKPDVVALSSGSAGLVWFKNPSWQKYTITTAARQLIHTAPYDVDGDGDVDLAFASDFSMSNTMTGGTISWAENPGDPTQDQDWTLHRIDAIPTTHRVRWADLDGNGKKELIALPLWGVGSSAPAHTGAVQLKAYTIPADPRPSTATWAAQILDDQRLETAHGIAIVNYDGDSTDDILTAANDGVDLFRPSLGRGAEHLAAGGPGQAPNRGSSEVALGRLGGARFIATIDPWHGTDGVIYTPGASATDVWTRQVLGSDFEHGHALAAADLNGDGYDEVIGGGGEGAMNQIIYRYVPSTRTWEKIKLDMGAVAVSAIDVQDMNGDGALDIVAIGGSTSNVVWYESAR